MTRRTQEPPSELGDMLDSIVKILKSTRTRCRREGSAVLVEGQTAPVRIDAESPAGGRNGIRAVFRVRYQLDTDVSRMLAAPKFASRMNGLASLGAITGHGPDGVVGSRLTVYAEEVAWELQSTLIAEAARVSGRAILGGMGRMMAGRRNGDERASRWKRADFARTAAILEQAAFFQADDEQLVGTIPLAPGAAPTIAGSRHAALLQMQRSAHPELGAGLFVLLRLPHIAEDARLLDATAVLNRKELEEADGPPHLGAWCRAAKGGELAYTSFLANDLHRLPNIAINFGAWAVARARLATEWLAGMGIGLDG